MTRTVQEKPEIQVNYGKITVSSLEVAKHFEKRHDNVLRDIEKIIESCPTEFNGLNFEAVEYLDTKGEKRPAYNLTRDGFSLLVMGFTGEKALQWKIRYIQAFNAMEQALQSGRPTSRQIAPGLCSPEEIRALKGAARLLAYFELKDFQDVMWGLCEFCGLSSLDNIPSGDFEDAFQYLVRRLQTFKTASGDQIKATDKQIAVIDGLKDYAAFMYENDSWKGKVHDNMGRLIDVENLSMGQANKLISMFAPGSRHRYITIKRIDT